MADTERPTAETKRDTAEYSATKAPETKAEAEEPRPFSDERLRPGGPHGSPAHVGPESLERDRTPSGGESPGLTEYSKTRRHEE